MHEGHAAASVRPIEAFRGRALLRRDAVLNAAVVESLRAELRDQRVHAVLPLQQFGLEPVLHEALEQRQRPTPLVGLRRGDEGRQLAVVAQEHDLLRAAVDDGHQRREFRGLRGLVDEDGGEALGGRLQAELLEHALTCAHVRGADHIRPHELLHGLEAVIVEAHAPQLGRHFVDVTETDDFDTQVGEPFCDVVNCGVVVTDYHHRRQTQVSHPMSQYLYGNLCLTGSWRALDYSNLIADRIGYCPTLEVVHSNVATFHRLSCNTFQLRRLPDLLS
mmetsp:Transcript_75094/g.242985  ORF Transcript_75094/g.242985 Transcript_75094/m.242985 type:complete len:276 (-) Transcript_75094:1657-2484(-)